MYRKYVLAAAVIATMAAPAFAATEYYVSKDVASHKCSVSEKKPDGKTATMIGKTGYKTEAEATTAMKAAADCK